MNSVNNSAGLDIIIGSMFSGKSSELLRRLGNVTEVGLKALYINNIIDDRNVNDVFSTHNPQLKSKLSNLSSNLIMIHTNDLNKVDDKLINSVDIIGIDECQFFEDITPILKWIKINNKRVIIASLDGDYKSNVFGNTLTLIPKCDTVIKLHAYCTKCANLSTGKKLVSASFTHKIKTLENKDMSKKSLIVDVGEHDKYEALCLSCYNEFNDYYYKN